MQAKYLHTFCWCVVRALKYDKSKKLVKLLENGFILSSLNTVEYVHAY